MANRNHTLKWINTLGSNKIAFENGIIDGTKMMHILLNLEKDY